MTIKENGAKYLSLLNDNEISLKAKGLYVFIETRGNDFKFSVKEIQKYCKESKDAITSGIQELEQKGYLERVKYQDERGFWLINYVCKL